MLSGPYESPHHVLQSQHKMQCSICSKTHTRPAYCIVHSPRVPGKSGHSSLHRQCSNLCSVMITTVREFGMKTITVFPHIIKLLSIFISFHDSIRYSHCTECERVFFYSSKLINFHIYYSFNVIDCATKLLQYYYGVSFSARSMGPGAVFSRRF